MQLMMSGSKEVTAFPCADNIMQWTATITGPDASVYEGMTLKLSIAFSDQYPHKAPTIKFTTPIFHPNVDLEGNICLDILKVQCSVTPIKFRIFIAMEFPRRTNGRQHTTFVQHYSASKVSWLVSFFG